MRPYTELTTPLARETSHPAPRAAAHTIEQQIAREHPGALAMVLFKAGEKWNIIPVGPGESIRNTAQASRARVNGRQAVAYCNRR